MSMGQNPIPPVNIPIPTQIGSRMGGAPKTPKWDPSVLTTTAISKTTYPKMAPLVLTHSHLQNRNGHHWASSGCFLPFFSKSVLVAWTIASRLRRPFLLPCLLSIENMFLWLLWITPVEYEKSTRTVGRGPTVGRTGEIHKKRIQTVSYCRQLSQG